MSRITTAQSFLLCSGLTLAAVGLLVWSDELNSDITRISVEKAEKLLPEKMQTLPDNVAAAAYETVLGRWYTSSSAGQFLVRKAEAKDGAPCTTVTTHVEKSPSSTLRLHRQNFDRASLWCKRPNDAGYSFVRAVEVNNT